jgi:hypothetical protein
MNTQNQACLAVKRLGERKATGGWPPLTLLDIGGCKRITDQGVLTVLGASPGLVTLDVRGLTLITDACLLPLRAKTACLGLQGLILYYCSGITRYCLDSLRVDRPGISVLHDDREPTS